ncbi:MAG TPA: alpha/beta hydrolase [Caulobacteraceae bacterium]|nr:alpha/beta hydrolase [Caulobacteraceae bacterium]
MRNKPWRLGWALALLLGVGACGQDAARDAFVDTRAPPGLAERFYPPESWAWGLIQVKDAPVQRYGVAAPEVTARAEVLILPDYGESAETWYETARDLRASGDIVWVLEGVGQGGSARGGKAVFDADAAGVRAMIDTVIRPQPRRPLVLLGEGAGGFVAALAVEEGAKPAALILSDASYDEALPASGDWRRDGPDDFAAHRTHDAWRGAITHLWQVANPDLRLGSPSDDWRNGLRDLRNRAVGGAARIQIPTLTLESADKPGCLQPPGAARQVIAGAAPALELEDDAHRGPWLAAIRAYIAAAAAKADPLAYGHAP